MPIPKTMLQHSQTVERERDCARPGCGVRFVPRVPTQRYCGVACRPTPRRRVRTTATWERTQEQPRTRAARQAASDVQVRTRDGAAERDADILRVSRVGARRLGRGGIQQRYTLDDPGRALLLARYDGKTETITELADRFGVPRHVVRKWGAQLGLARVKEPPWSTSEVTYLEHWLHRRSIKWIAQHLNRSQTAVRLKAKRQGLAKSAQGYTLGRLCVALGVDHHKVHRWIAAGWLGGVRRESDRTPQQGGDLWFFRDRDIRAFVTAHPLEVDPRRVEWVWLVSVLTDVYL